MSLKKRITEAVRSANQANAKLSTGPRTEEGKKRSSKNSLRHGILARKVTFATHEERQEYRMIKRAWKEYFHPHGTLEKFVVDEIALMSWKLGVVEGFEMQELLRRQDSPDGIDSVFHREPELPVRGWDLPIDRGWDCERIVVRAVAGDDRKRDQDRHGSHLEVQAVLGSALGTFTRYATALKRDFYRAIEKLLAVQKERREREQSERAADEMDGRPLSTDAWEG